MTDHLDPAAINARAYRDYLERHPRVTAITLTRPQLEAICRDLEAYTDRDAEATAWAEQATRSAAEMARLRVVVDAALRDREHFRECADCEDEVCAIGAEYIAKLAEAVDACADFEQARRVATGMAIVREITGEGTP
jgi:hypothetical protein